MLITTVCFIFVTSHVKTYTNGFPLNGWNARLSNGLETAYQAVWNGWNWTAERLMNFSERIAMNGWTAHEKFRTDGHERVNGLLIILNGSWKFLNG